MKYYSRLLRLLCWTNRKEAVVVATSFAMQRSKDCYYSIYISFDNIKSRIKKASRAKQAKIKVSELPPAGHIDKTIPCSNKCEV
jgi:hypothetical protein